MSPFGSRNLLRSSLAAVILLALLGDARAQHVAPTEALTPAEELTKLKVPPGFELQLFASEPAIHKPMNMTFDARGRLWITDTVEYPFPVKPGVRGRDTVKVLVDTDHDGAADQVTTFVDGLNIPLGVHPIDGGVLVFSIPMIWRCLDTDGDGKADKREEFFGPFGMADTHGLTNSFTRGLDGWIYATHGYANTTTLKGTDGQSITMNSGNTYRMRPDGSRVEYFAHGQVNPFGLAFDHLGNLYSADCHTLPVYQLLRGAYYPSFGKAHDGLDFGPNMMSHDHGSTAIGGIVYYAAQQFPPEFRDNVFVGNPVTCRVNRDRLETHGSTNLAIEMPDLVSSDDPWFRPVNLQVGPDGALYIADFYNRIIGHYEVPLDHPGRDRERGRIWRLVYTGKGVANAPSVAPAAAPKVAGASVEQLIALLADTNLTVRTLTTHELVDHIGKPAAAAVTAMLKSDRSHPLQRAHGVWVLERLGALDDAMIEKLSADPDRTVRVHLLKALAERREWQTSALAELARRKLSDEDAFVRRAATDALGRHPQAENVKPLLDLWSNTPADDTHLVHTVRMALRDHLAAGLYDKLPRLVGNDKATRQRLANVSLGVGNADSAAFIFDEFQSDAPGPRDAYLHHVVRHAASEQLSKVYEYALGLQQGDAGQQAVLVRAIGGGAQERGAKLPDQITAWSARLIAELLSSDEEPLVRDGIDLARDFRSAAAFTSLAKAAGREARFGGQRQAAIDACVASDGDKSIRVLSAILNDSADQVDMRQLSAAALARINSDAARETLVANLQTAPEQLAVATAAALAESPQGAELLLATIAAGKASPRLLQEAPVVGRVRARRLPDIDNRLAKLTSGLPPDDQRIRELIGRRRELVAQGKGDAGAGEKVFEKVCAACHRIGDVGAKVGPNLDGIGVRGVDRLLEDVLDPNRNVDQSFRTTQIVTADGRIVAGLALREEGQVIVLADAQGKEVRVAADEIDERTVSSLSIMPANISEQVEDASFADLMAYLLAQRQAVEHPKP